MLLRGQPGQSPQVVALPPATAPNAPGTTPASPAPGPGAPGAGPGESGWPFPFPPPAAQRPGDNRAITVNTQDGSAVYDVAFAVVWVSGQDVTQRNDAIALANCSNCKTVSVAFQAVFIVGYSQVVTPVNTSLAVNYGCENCETAAIAVQLVTSLTALPDPATMAQLNTMWQQLDQLATQVPDLSVDEIYTRLHGIEAQILQILDNAGPDIVNTGDTIPAQSGTTPSAAPGASSSAAPASGGSAPATGTTPDQPANPAPAPSGSTPSGTATQAPGTTGDSSGTAPGGSPATTGSSATPAPAPAETTDTTTVGAPEPATAPPAPSADAPAG
jgi:putative peptide zinc metalloprotease protein